MAKFIALVNGVPTEQQTATTGGAPDANKIPSLDGSGKFTMAMMPSGLGQETKVLPAKGAISANDTINIFNDGGIMKVRKADAGANQYRAHGYVTAAYADAANATVFLEGTCAGQTFVVGDAGKPVYLSNATPGAVVITPVSTAGHISQEVGIIISATEFTFSALTPFVLA